jgi:DNA-repair protein XRCC1
MDIGNDGSAFVEVLVGRSGSTSDDGYQVLLVTSSFMSPSESKSNSNTNRVRMFGKVDINVFNVKFMTLLTGIVN